MSRIKLSDRMAVEAGLYAKLSLTEIAKKIGKSEKYVSEELRRNRIVVPGEKVNENDCLYALNCKRVRLCGNDYCKMRCATCKIMDCRNFCHRYTDSQCNRLKQPPYVCNTCLGRRRCKLDRAYYIANQANSIAQKRYSMARSKPHVRGEELAKLNKLVSPLIKKGQPLTHIYAEHKDELPVSQRTLYNYISSGMLSIGNLDLRRKVGYRPRKKKYHPSDQFLRQECRQNRTYEDFHAYMAKNPATQYVEMDTVRGCREKGKRMLTFFFVKQNILLILLMRDGTGETVVEQFDWLTNALGLSAFRKLFPVILTDNGAEFKRIGELELAENGERRTRVFYCDPLASWQKAHIEKSHEFIRYVLPKGKSFSPYTQEDMCLLMNHINSTKRTSLAGQAPFELATSKELQKLMEVLNLHLISADEVNLTPRLLRRTVAD